MIVAQLIFSGVYPIPVAFYEVDEDAKKMPLGQKLKKFCDIISQSGVCFG